MKIRRKDAAVRRIAARSMHTNRTRNLFAALAILLTTFMISTVFSIGLSFAENYQATQVRLNGTTASIFLNNPSASQTQQIAASDQLEAVGTQIAVGSTTQKTRDGKPTNIALLSYDQTEWERHITPAVGEIHGNYPDASDEIMLSTRALEQLGIELPREGMAVPLTYLLHGKTRSDTFRLSGWYTEYKITQSGGEALVSSSFCNQHALTAEGNGILAVSCKASRQEAVFETLEQNIPLREGQSFQASFSAAQESASGTTITTAVIVMLALFIVLSGYLLISNVMYISVARDIRFYGMLKTIGASSRQIKRLVRLQALRLSLIGIPAGLLLGAGASFGIVPFALNMFASSMTGMEASSGVISFHPLIFIGTACFSLLTVFVSCRKPAKLAASVSPIEALRRADLSPTKKQQLRKTTHGGKARRMAFYNVFRDKKRAALVLASLFMGTVTLLGVNSFIGSMKAENFVNRYFPHDFTYQSTPPLANQKFDQDFLAALSGLDGVTHREVVTAEPCSMPFDTDISGALARKDYDNWLAGKGESYDTFLASLQKKARDGKYGTWVFAIDDSYVEDYNKTHDHAIDLNAFRRGEIVILGYGEEAAFHEMIGKKITLTGDRSNQQKEAVIGGIFSYQDCSFAATSKTLGAPDGLFVSKAFMEQFSPSPIVTNIQLDVDPQMEPQIANRLSALNQTLTDDSYQFSRRSERAETFASDMSSMNVLGSGISLLLLLIGVLNFINVMVTGVYSRRQELAVLESIGMTKRQISGMLTWEGFYYALFTAGCMLTLGNGVLYLISKAVVQIADYTVFSYPFGLVVCLIAVLFAVCLTVPAIVFRMTAKESVTQRLHRAD